MIRLGQKLKDARIQRRLSLEEVATATKIKLQFLEAIEKEEYGELPSFAYVQGFVKNYADYLGLPKEQTAALFKRDYDEKKAIKVLPDRINNQQSFPLERIKIREITIGLLAVMLLFLFLFFQIRNIYIAPYVSITSPKEGSTVSSEVEVIGRTDSNAIVAVNNEPVFVQENGEFRKMITLFPGKTIITIKAKNRTGRETIFKRQVIVK